MELPTPPTLSVRKRFRVSYEDEVGEKGGPRTKKVRFPKGKKTPTGEDPGRNLGVIDGEEDEGPILLSADPRIAAKERALKRDSTTEQIRVEDTGVLADVTKAEEEYEQEDEELVEDGQRFEPFNLKQEREEGYFDAQGNYVEYRSESDGKDAWLESVEVDTRFASKALAENEKAEDEKDNLGREELWAIKQRIADALQPGETVLKALRRLKGTPKDGSKREKMSEENKALFDQLTEDAVKLLDDGDYNVYEETRETFQREAEGYAAVARLRAGITNGNAVGSSQAGVESDMFGDDDESKEQVGPSNQSSGLVAAGVGNFNGKEQDMFGDDDDEITPTSGGIDNGDAAQQVAAPASEGTITIAKWATTTIHTPECTAVPPQVYGTDLTRKRTRTSKLHNEAGRAVAWQCRKRLAPVSDVSVYCNLIFHTKEFGDEVTYQFRDCYYRNILCFDIVTLVRWIPHGSCLTYIRSGFIIHLAFDWYFA